jgi:hypothetical protein
MRKKELVEIFKKYCAAGSKYSEDSIPDEEPLMTLSELKTFFIVE